MKALSSVQLNKHATVRLLIMSQKPKLWDSKDNIIFPHYQITTMY